MIRVVLVDDHALVVAGLNEIIDAAEGIDVVGSAYDAVEALRSVCEQAPDVVILDIQLGDLSGIYVASELIRKMPDTKIIFLTGLTSYFFSIRLFEMGVQGYLDKSASPETVISAIRSVAHGEKVLAPALAARLALARVMAYKTFKFHALSDSALEVAMMIARGISLSEIAERLQLTLPKIHAYRDNILKKTGVMDDSELRKLAIKEGIVCSYSL